MCEMISYINHIILAFLFRVCYEGISSSSVRSNQLKEHTTNNRDGELLEFWDPKPKLDNRKSWQDQISAEYDKFTNFRRSNQHNHRTSRTRLNSILRRFDNNKIQPVNKYPKTHESDNKSPDNMNFRSKKKEKKGSDSKEVKKTRITPALLRQQEGPTPNTVPKKQQSDVLENLKPLNVYNLEKQIGDVLSKFPEANVTTEILGRTASYNDIVLFKISKLNERNAYLRADDSKYIDEVPEKNIVFIVHALSVMGIKDVYALTRINFMETLFWYYIKHLDKFDIYLIPMANPDGYVKNEWEYMQPKLWNKNLSPRAGCPGVDLDRNFDVAWNQSEGVSPCSQHYPGPSPFSEPESRAVRDVFHNYGHKIVAYFHVHAGSFSNYILKGDAVLYPRGYTDVPSNDDKYLDLKGEIDEAIKNSTFRALSVTVDTLHNWYGKVSGTSVDYASTVYGIPFAVELVMQVYVSSKDTLDNYFKYNQEYLQTQSAALTEVWSMVLDCVFNSVYKNLAVTE